MVQTDSLQSGWMHPPLAASCSPSTHQSLEEAGLALFSARLTTDVHSAQPKMLLERKASRLSLRSTASGAGGRSRLHQHECIYGTETEMSHACTSNMCAAVVGCLAEKVCCPTCAHIVA